MREIKFRAWDTIENKMSEEFGLFDIDSGREQSSIPGFYSFEGDDQENYKIMQYTGLKDKNEKEIYEGDILRARTEGPEWIGDVFYTKGSIWLRTPTISRFDDAAMLFCIPNCEVIGNIYENPELLEEENV